MTHPVNGPDPTSNKQFQVNQSTNSGQTNNPNSHMEYAVMSAMKDLITMNLKESQQSGAMSQDATMVAALFNPLKSATTLSGAVQGLTANLKMMQSKMSDLQQELNKPGLSATKKNELQNQHSFLSAAYNKGEQAYTSLNAQLTKTNTAEVATRKPILFAYIFGSHTYAEQYIEVYKDDEKMGMNEASTIGKQQNDTAHNNLQSSGNQQYAQAGALKMIRGVFTNLANAMMNMND